MMVWAVVSVHHLLFIQKCSLIVKGKNVLEINIKINIMVIINNVNYI